MVYLQSYLRILATASEVMQSLTLIQRDNGERFGNAKEIYRLAFSELIYQAMPHRIEDGLVIIRSDGKEYTIAKGELGKSPIYSHLIEEGPMDGLSYDRTTRDESAEEGLLLEAEEETEEIQLTEEQESAIEEFEEKDPGEEAEERTSDLEAQSYMGRGLPTPKETEVEEEPATLDENGLYQIEDEEEAPVPSEQKTETEAEAAAFPEEEPTPAQEPKEEPEDREEEEIFDLAMDPLGEDVEEPDFGDVQNGAIEEELEKEDEAEFTTETKEEEPPQEMLPEAAEEVEEEEDIEEYVPKIETISYLKSTDFTFNYIKTFLRAEEGDERIEILTMPLYPEEENSAQVACVVRNGDMKTVASSRESPDITIVVDADTSLVVKGRIKEGQYFPEVIADPLPEGKEFVIETQKGFGTRGHVQAYDEDSNTEVHILPINFRNNEDTGNADYAYYINVNGDIQIGNTLESPHVVTEINGEIVTVTCKWDDQEILYMQIS